LTSITLSVPAEVKKKMDDFSEVNWSGFVRKCIVLKTSELEWKEKMLERLKKEALVSEWAVKTLKKSRCNRFKFLKQKGLM
jgi:hypothetical protein